MSRMQRGATAIVTGAVGGIGLAIVRALAAEGINVACWDRHGSDFSAAVAVSEDAGVLCLPVEVDVANRDSVMAAAHASAAFGAVKYAVNCAGIDHLEPSVEMSEESWRKVIDVNLTGVYFSCLGEYSLMKDEGGSIVNIASISGVIYNRGADPHLGYSSSKAAVIHLSKTLAVEWAPQAIRVNAVSPGYTRTAMTAHNPQERNRYFAEQTPMGRMAEVEEVADPVVFLLGSGASFVNGINLVVDGALSAW